MSDAAKDAPRPDEDLVRAAQAGDLQAYEELVTRHERRIYTLALRITGSVEDAQDVTQQAFVNAMDHLDSFRGAAAFGTWITRIAANTALKVLRKRRGLPTVSLDAATTPDDDGRIPHPEYVAEWRDTPDRLADLRETRALIDAAVAALDEKSRAVFLLRDAEGLSVKEAARALGMTEANVKVRLMRARLALREKLTRVFGDPARRLETGHPHGGTAPQPATGGRSLP
jgi:RNA polymerase sigma-70 factor (ECF subfamily)